MNDLDALIYKLALLSCLVALMARSNPVPALLLCLSLLLDEYIFVASPSWQELEKYFFQMAAKDLLVSVALFLMYKPSTFMLGMLFIVSALFHKFAQIEVANKILDLKHIRTDFVTYITVFQLATIYASLLEPRSGNGGKRARRAVFNSNSPSRSILHLQAFKVKP